MLAALQGLEQASKLEALQAWLGNSSARDLDLITSLPALRKVCIPIFLCEWSGDDDDFPHPVERAAAAICVIKRAMPQVNTLEARDYLSFDEFLRWALE